MGGQKFHVLLAFIALSSLPFQMAQGGVPAVFIFGDSTVDVGNNNFLSAAMAKANFPPYGIDFLRRASTGRFSNGFNVADVVAKMIGLKSSPPPFLVLGGGESWKLALRGVNFASGGSGIFDATGKISGEVINLKEQVQFLEMISANFTANMGSPRTEKLLSKSIFLLSAGGNDLFEAFAANATGNETAKNALLDTLVFTYKQHFEALYELGARKFAVISIAPLGCLPSIRCRSPSGDCIDDLNALAMKFFARMKSTMTHLRDQLEELEFALGNAYDMVVQLFDDPIAYGFKDAKSACCGGGRFNGESPCLSSSTLCENRREYLFWDRNHPTEAASQLVAQLLFNGPEKFVTPINFSQLSNKRIR